MLTKSFLLASVALCFSLSTAKAQTFTSGAFALDGSSLEDVGSVVTAVHYYRFNDSTITINGITFTNVQGQAPDGTTYNPEVGPDVSFNGGGIDGTGGGLTGASAAVTTLNSEGEYYGSTFTLSGLTVGTTYAAQFIFDANGSDYRATYLTDGSATSATVTGGIPGPQYITDTFTATSTMETIGRAGSGINGTVQVSGVLVEVAPEPSTWAMMGLSLVGMVYLVRRPLARS